MKENKFMNNDFDRLFKLAQTTKSTLVVYDRVGENHCVVLGIDQFEKMSSKTSTVVEEKNEETVPIAPKAPVVDLDLKSDEAVLEALNQKIEAWRNTQVMVEPPKNELNTESVQDVPVPENSTFDHAPEEPTQSIALPVIDSSNKPTTIPHTSSKSSSWHRLGDVIAETLKPKMPEVRYEELGEPEVALPVTQVDGLESFSEPEALDDEPLFLEEPAS